MELFQKPPAGRLWNDLQKQSAKAAPELLSGAVSFEEWKKLEAEERRDLD